MSSTDAPLAFAVLTTERKAAYVSAPHSQRKPLVTLRKITLGRKWRSEMLFVYGTGRLLRRARSAGGAIRLLPL